MSNGEYTGESGFEFPDDPDAELPVPARTDAPSWQPPAQPAFPSQPPAQAPTQPPAQQPGQTGFTFTPPPVADPAAPAYAPQAYTPPPPPPSAYDVQHPAPTPPAQPAEAVSAEDVTALLGFDPDSLPPAQTEAPPALTGGPAAPPPPPPPGSPYMASAPRRAPSSVPVEDPRAALGLADDHSQVFTPKAPLTVSENRPEIERLLVGLVNGNGSDMHITHGEQPRYRVAGSLLPISGEDELTTADIDRMLKEIASPAQWEEFTSGGDVDFAYSMEESKGAAITVRFRVNAYRSMDQSGAVFRVIPTKIVTLDQLGVPPQVKTLAQKPRGLILFCGPTGSGKSTSMAGLVDLINETRDERIFTLEDPIEFTHRSKKSLISHREVGADTASFVEGLKRVRRQDPDVILIGEMRDYETIGAAIEAADTGHLVIATLHTNSAPETISRIINSFPAERQDQIRVTLSSTLLAVICQALVPSQTAPRGRVVATEIMMVTPGIANNIRENDIPAIVNALTDRETGSMSLDAHLVQLIQEQKITKRDALKKASSPEALERQLGNTDR